MALTYTLITDTTVTGSAVTSVDFTGLTGVCGEEYMLISSIVNPQGSNVDYYMYFNNNTTNTNYYYQYLYAFGTSRTGARGNNPRYCEGLASKNNLTVSLIRLTNNGYCLAHSKTTRGLAGSTVDIQNYDLSSTFTATSITQLTLVSATASSIGVGSRFQLYKLNAEVIADVTVSTATTSVSMTGLSIAKDSEYSLACDIVGIGSATVNYIYANGDTTNTNYYSQNVNVSSTTLTPARANTPSFIDCAANTKNFAITNIKLTNDGYFYYWGSGIRSYGGSAIMQRISTGASTGTLSSITSLTITSDTTNGIAAGSRFCLLKLK